MEFASAGDPTNPPLTGKSPLFCAILTASTLLPMRLKDCPVARTLRLMNGKWKPSILFELKDSRIRPGELARRIPEASAKVLTQQLKELEEDGLVRRRVYREVPPRVEYSLTSFGDSLRPVLQAIADWGEKNKIRSSRRRIRAGLAGKHT